MLEEEERTLAGVLSDLSTVLLSIDLGEGWEGGGEGGERGKKKKTRKMTDEEKKPGTGEASEKERGGREKTGKRTR